MMDNKELDYRGEPTSSCPYPLETTPQVHYVSAAHKIVELILINRFGKKNIPSGNFWRLKDTSKEVYGAQKYLWPVIKRLLKTYEDTIVLSMVQRKNIKYLTSKMIPKYLYWCKEEIDQIARINSQKVRYNRGEALNETPVINIEKKKEDNLLDWLDS
jgi:hypothetical protein